MLTKRLLGALAILGIVTTVGLRAQPTSECQFCGTWILIDRIDKTVDGKILPESNLGSDPLGIIVYDAAGNVAAQLMKRNRTEVTAAPSADRGKPSNNSAATNGYDAYFGKYEVDQRAHTITHRLEAAIDARDIGKSLVRSYEFVDGELHLAFDTTNDGVRVRRTLRWRRAA